MGTFNQQKQQIVDTAQTLVHKGSLMATGGNLSLHIPGQTHLPLPHPIMTI